MKNAGKFVAIALMIFIFTAVNAAVLWAADTAPVTPENQNEEQNLVKAAASMRATGRVQFNFKDLDIILFVRFMSELLGENLVVNPGVRGTVSILSPKPVSVQDARQVMLSILEMNGLALQGMGSYSKVVPINIGPSSENEVIKGPQSVAPSEQMVVQIVPLEYVKAGYVVEPIRAGVPGLTIMPLVSNNGVLITGKAVLLNRAASVIRAIDVPDSVRSMKTYTMKFTSAKLVEGHLNALAQDINSNLAGVFSMGDERSGKITVVGDRGALAEAERIMNELDIQSTIDNFHIYRLQNADAKTLAEQLSQILAVAARMQADPNQATPASVVPDLPTNSLILTASREQFAAIKSVIEELDIQPRQVMLRGLIAEVNLTKLNSAGIDWAAWGGEAGSDVLAGGNAQFGAAGVPAQFMQWFTEMTRTEEVHYDANGNAVTTSNIHGMGLVYAYIKMLNQFNAINVLSMPRLMCTDNLPSALQVGQVIPQMTGTLSDVSNPSAVQSSYQYKDTGLILKVTPHIRTGNLVAFEIELTIEDVLSTSGSTTPVTSKRLIQTNVLVANNQTIILGGLIREVEKTLKNRVPGISYIPLVGNLFTSQERQREKVDLMVFLTPRIIETPVDAVNATNEVTTDTTIFSPGEEMTIERNAEEFRKSNKQEGIDLEILLNKYRNKPPEAE
ncbi:MAG: type II secretion system secretin GspD [Synergistaceae bacterium]|nr:type II secretion system secretin GspD [Synergistaceae bacterium]